MPSQRNIVPLSELPLRNDFMFGEVMRTSEICQLFLEELLGVSIQRIEFVDKQKDLSDSYAYHGIRLDVYLKDKAGTVFDVEMQSVPNGNLAKRARFYQSAIDRSELPKAVDYDKLSESYVIFVCNFDYFEIGKAVGERVSFLKGTETVYDDGSHVFFLNSHYTEDNASRSILEFLDMIRTNDLEKVYETPLGQKAKARVQAVRNDRTLEVAYMTYAQKLLDERKLAFHEGLVEGEAKGRTEGVNESIAALKGLLEPAVIAEKFKVPLERVLKIFEQ